MKKFLLFFALIMSILFTVNAGYLIRGIQTPLSNDELKNYTLTFYKGEEPISAASMHTNLVYYTGKNTIAIIHANSPFADVFPIQLPYISNINDIEVRDFHYDWSNDRYVLCGSLSSNFGLRAFVAVINSYLTQMEFFEYPEADMFYSICDPNPPTPALNYYLCGTKDNFGIIASVDKIFLQLNNFYITEVPWEYHKIIVSNNVSSHVQTRFVVSGRNPVHSHIGFTTLDHFFNPINSYMWPQMTEQDSHCVVSDDVMKDNAVILASSYQNIVTLNPVTYPISSLIVDAYRYSFTVFHRYYVQDIGIIRLNGNNFSISVAGFSINPIIADHITAWHGYVTGLSTINIMTSNSYYETGKYYEHYKIRYRQDPGSLFPKEYTGGFFRSVDEMGALFATPLTQSECDIPYLNYPEYKEIEYDEFALDTKKFSHSSPNIYPSFPPYFMEEQECPIFKGEEPTPEFAMLIENETEITTFYDRIIVKDIPINTQYQIFSIHGQLLQTGTTNPNISTVNLSKGIYILRLENDKAFKFIK